MPIKDQGIDLVLQDVYNKYHAQFSVNLEQNYNTHHSLERSSEHYSMDWHSVLRKDSVLGFL